MKLNFSYYSIVLAILIFTGCTTTPQAVYKENSIKIHYEAEKKINIYNNRPHSVVLMVYQLETPNEFQKLSKTKSGIEQLINGRTKGVSITSSRHIIAPNADGSILLDRFNKTKYIGLVAGFFKYDNIENLTLVEQIVADFNEYEDMQIRLKINKDSIHSRVYKEQLKVDTRDVYVEGL